MSDMVKPGLHHEQRWISFDLIPGQHLRATFQAHPLLVIPQMVAKSCDQAACCLHVPGGQGVMKRFFDSAVFGKPGTGLSVKAVDFLSAAATL